MHIDTRTGAPSSKVQNQENIQSTKGPIEQTKQNISSFFHGNNNKSQSTSSSSKNLNTSSSSNNASSLNNSSSMNNSNIQIDPSTGHLPGCTAAKSSSSSSKNINQNISCSNGQCAQAQATARSILNRDGKSDTTVYEGMAPGVTHEHIHNALHSEDQNVIDREHQQAHAHTSVQPVRDSAQGAITSEHNIAPTERRDISHGDESKIRQQIQGERNAYRNTRDQGATTTTSSTNPTITGDHHHHHVSENIQPIVEKDIHQQHIVHTTKPVHEVHHNQTMHHGTSVLPEISMDEFQRNGGTLNGRSERTDHFEGAPHAIDDSRGATHNNVLGGKGAQGSTSITSSSSGARDASGKHVCNVDPSMSSSSNMNSSNIPTSSTKSSSTNYSSTNNMNTDQFDSKAGIKRTDNMGSSQKNTGIGSGSANSSAAAGGTAFGAGGAGAAIAGSGAPSTGLSGVKDQAKIKNGKGTGHNSDSSIKNSSNIGKDSSKKGSMLDKLNPTKDSTGQGKPGFMH